MRRFHLGVGLVGALTAAVALALVVAPLSGGSGNGKDEVVVPPGQPVQVAVVLASEDSLASLMEGIRGGIGTAVAAHATVHGFAVQLNPVSAPCFGADSVAANAAVAQSVVASAQNVAVIGHVCSLSFANTAPFDGDCVPPTNDGSPSALSIYEAQGVVTINGSTTNPCLPFIGPTVFNATIPPDTADPGWYAKVKALPSDAAWRSAFAFASGTAAQDLVDTYYDATALLLEQLDQASSVRGSSLVIDRRKLASQVRSAKDCGATGEVRLDPGGFRVDTVKACG